MHLPDELLSHFAPSGEALLDVIRTRVDDVSLRLIASADYGEDADAHLRALLPIRDTGQVPVPLEWHPREVLELTRASNSDMASEIVVFACAVLLREPENEHIGEESTLKQLLAHALVLDREVQEATGSLLAWRMQQGVDVDDRWDHAVVLLFLSLFLWPDRIAERDISTLAEWIDAEDPEGNKTLVQDTSFDGIEYQFPWENPRGVFERILDRVSSMPSRDLQQRVVGTLRRTIADTGILHRTYGTTKIDTSRFFVDR